MVGWVAPPKVGQPNPVSIPVEFRKASAERHFQGDGPCQLARVELIVQGYIGITVGGDEPGRLRMVDVGSPHLTCNGVPFGMEEHPERYLH